VCAVVEPPADGEHAGAEITFEEMTRYLTDEGLMRQKIPEQLEVVDALPRNETLRKVLKYKLRERFAGA
jgi:non-ribosomal peptide synthetase component E (peptide arylation enzyme)